MTTRVLLAEDNLLVREGLAKLLSTADDLEVVAVCGDYDELVAKTESDSPDVVVTDIRMPPTGTDEGIRAAAELRSTRPKVGVVVLSQYLEPGYAVTLFDSGSNGRAYLLKDRVSDLDQLVAAVRTVAAGGSVIDPLVVDSLVAARSKAPDSPLARLTGRELDVLREMATGKSNGGIAQALVLSERAVEKHINSIFSKLDLGAEPGIHRRVKAVLLFLADRDADREL
ncbi:MAG TPA: response regulator transcription factor [Acidimicrobiales bacterium]|nr:response regulator transcription factor [Acidimicrobiales bacterium]